MKSTTAKSSLLYLKQKAAFVKLPKIKEPFNLLKETVADDLEQLRISEDQDAKVGHKSADSSFFGYKTHIAMTEERIITAAIVTTGEKNDGKQLQTLIEKSKAAGMEVKTVIGDTAYSEKENIKYSKENEIELVAKLNPRITQGARKKEDEFQFNKGPRARFIFFWSDLHVPICAGKDRDHSSIRSGHYHDKGQSGDEVEIYLMYQASRTQSSYPTQGLTRFHNVVNFDAFLVT